MSENNDIDWDMSDEDLEVAFKEAVHARDSTDIQEEDTTADEEFEVEQEEFIEDEQPDEQPQDSDHDMGVEADEETEEKEELADTSEDTPEEETSDTEDVRLAEPDVTKTEETQPVEDLKFKANGREYKFSDKEMLKQFPRVFGQAMDYTKKMQAIKPWRKTIDAIESAKLNHEDVSLMIDVLKGDKEAIGEVLKRTGVDTLDLDSEGKDYVAKSYGRDDVTLALADVVESIKDDPEYTVTQRVLSKEWDDKSWNEMSEDPETIRLFHMDVKSGMYDVIQPIADKLKVYSGGKQSDLDYYKTAARQYYAEEAQKKAESNTTLSKQSEQAEISRVKSEEVARTSVKTASKKRRAAAPTRSSVGSSSGVIDYLNAPEGDFDAWYASIEDT